MRRNRYSKSDTSRCNRTGTMLTRVHLVSTSLTLEKGQRVQLVAATNIPNGFKDGKWFATPLAGLWPDGHKRDPMDSILVQREDVELDPAGEEQADRCNICGRAEDEHHSYCPEAQEPGEEPPPFEGANNL